eukprot:TRINITY_DN2268_c0_g1_i2.p2 TRINITY_DN2268_c0_g1~~TRINITY_DN2268_c0_g1_i2.p2  ORF type:complete len:148 (+),score=27.42 TRINITY_DN2268_c0_g1_i2:253-696(+)
MAALNSGVLAAVEAPRMRLSSRSIDDYVLDDQIGEGTYGQVYRGRHKATNTVVALKKIRMENEKEGFPFTAIREVKILKELSHANVVQLLEIVSDVDSNDTSRRGSIYLVFEFMHHDLAGLMDSPMSGEWRSENASRALIFQHGCVE